MAKDVNLVVRKLEELRLKMFSDFKDDQRTLVFLAGNPIADILLVGEAPGAEEDKQGLPFVGKSGRELNSMLSNIGLKRTELAVTNVMPFRPPDNRSPTPEEVQLYSKYLEEQVAIVRPSVIVTLGATPTRYFIPTSRKMYSLRGTPRKDPVRGCYILPTYHPSYVCRVPTMRSYMEEDLNTASWLSKFVTYQRNNVSIVPSFSPISIGEVEPLLYPIPVVGTVNTKADPLGIAVGRRSLGGD